MLLANVVRPPDLDKCVGTIDPMHIYRLFTSRIEMCAAVVLLCSFLGRCQRLRESRTRLRQFEQVNYRGIVEHAFLLMGIYLSAKKNNLFVTPINKPVICFLRPQISILSTF